jgi:hypothetical protein
MRRCMIVMIITLSNGLDSLHLLTFQLIGEP